MKSGVLQQVGAPRELYSAPAERVRRRVHRQPRDEHLHGAGRRRRRAVRLEPSCRSSATALARRRRRGARSACGPRISIVAAGEGEGLAVTVDLVEELGADGYIYAHGDTDGQRVDIVARVSGAAYPELGETVYLGAKPGRVHVFDAETGERLNGPVGLERGAESRSLLPELTVSRPVARAVVEVRLGRSRP